MGTTVAALLMDGDRAAAGNLGDSRIYLFRSSQLTQISTDDTIIAGMLEKGMLSPADAATHPLRNVLTQSAGTQESVDVHLWEGCLLPGDTLLLCSDGLHGVVEEPAIRSILGGGDSAERSVDRLISASIAAGAPDNVSAVLLRYS
jgi:protein phosphatase